MSAKIVATSEGSGSRTGLTPILRDPTLCSPISGNGPTLFLRGAAQAVHDGAAQSRLGNLDRVDGPDAGSIQTM